MSLHLAQFDIIIRILFDSLHCLDLGVMKQLTSLWFDSKNCDEPWYMVLSIKDINNKLSNVFPSLNVSRLPTSLSLRSSWKFSEWRNELLSTIYFQMISSRTVYNNFVVFSTSIYLLNQKSVILDELNIPPQNYLIIRQGFPKIIGPR